MPRIDTTEAVAGMILAQDVTTLEGQVLLRKGLALSPRHVTALKAWGIEQIQVSDGEVSEGTEPATRDVKPAQIAKIEEKLIRAFRHTDPNHPVVEILFREARRRRLGGVE